MNILFLSAIDFKDKSIQVIRKTPVAYAEDGWDVDYVVARDNLAKGNYHYESEINPADIVVHRIYWPFTTLRSRLPRLLFLLLNKLTALFIVLRLATVAVRLGGTKNFDVVYGYEMHGVLAVRIARLLNSRLRQAVFVSRFQGTFLEEMFKKKQYARLLFNSDLIVALRTKSDLLIMTNDGTQGDKALARVLRSTDHTRFWVNGVDYPTVQRRPEIVKARQTRFLSISRLVGWKRVDRNLKILAALKAKGFSDFDYNIVGDGDLMPSLQALTKELGLSDQVTFMGALNHEAAMKELQDCDIFLSMYESSNVGNPLLEAIRAGKVIATLKNGDTASWIEHLQNGLIFQEQDNLSDVASDALIKLLTTPGQIETMIARVTETGERKLWTWEQRLKAETREVYALCE